MSATRPDLPIHLVLDTVRVVGTRDATTIRWTLGPTWYDELVDDSNVPAYAEDGTPGTPSDTVKSWAADAIARTTPYRVTGWTGTVPTLEYRVMSMEISTIDGRVYRPTVPEQTGMECLRALTGDNNVLMFPSPDHDAMTYIPVRAVARITTCVTGEPVDNE